MNNYRILVVDDEEDLCEILRFNLENEGYDVDIAFSAEEALELNLTQYHMFLLDVMMDKMSGFELGSRIKKNSLTKMKPVMFLTAKETENDKLTGFSIGADDYIAKPFSVREVIARVKAVLQRVYPEDLQKDKIIRFESLELSIDKKQLIINRETVNLTPKEFDILLLLLKNTGHVFSRDELMTKVWKDNVYVIARTVDVNITRLRKKLGVYGKNIVTRAGYGYSFSH